LCSTTFLFCLLYRINKSTRLGPREELYYSDNDTPDVKQKKDWFKTQVWLKSVDRKKRVGREASTGQNSTDDIGGDVNDGDEHYQDADDIMLSDRGRSDGLTGRGRPRGAAVDGGRSAHGGGRGNKRKNGVESEFVTEPNAPSPSGSGAPSS
jgi:hypothetical protein